MKTYKHLFPGVVSFGNLLRAAQQAAKGKRKRPDVAAFQLRQESELFKLQEELTGKTYQPAGYRTFFVHDPKERMISAAPFRDRVVHHALCQVIEPLFEKTFIHDSYANRKGKGTHKAIRRYQYYARKHPYVLKCDIRKFFASIDHQVLKQELRWKIRCPDTLWLIDLIIDHSNPQEYHLDWFGGDNLFAPLDRRRGLPIGNLTSQFWANVYMNRFDHYMKETLGVPGYIRYVDDFVLFAQEKASLQDWKRDISQYLQRLRLRPHPNKTQIHRTCDGVPFLGFRIYPYYHYVKKDKVKRYRRYLNRTLREKQAGQISPQQLEDRLNAWLGHIRFGQSQRLENVIFRYIRSQGVNLVVHPNGSWRVLEQQ